MVQIGESQKWNVDNRRQSVGGTELQCRKRAGILEWKWKWKQSPYNAQMGLVSVFSWWGCCRNPPNIKNMPIWACFWCSAGGKVADTHRALKTCPYGHVFSVREVEGWWIHAEH